MDGTSAHFLSCEDCCVRLPSNPLLVACFIKCNTKIEAGGDLGSLPTLLIVKMGKVFPLLT